MTNTNFILREKGGVNHIALSPSIKAEGSHFGVIDGALILGFLVAFMGLVFLLAR
jgi:hypothetical protein